MPNPPQPCVIGVDIGGTNLRLALADLSGTILARSTASTVGIKDPAHIVDIIRTHTETLLNQTATPKSSLRAIAAGAPGITDTDTGVVIVTSYLLGWRDVPLRALLQDSLHIPAAVDNDVNLAALGEARAGAGIGAPDFVFLAIGTGIGAGIILNKKLFRGASFLAGEVGYMLLPGLPPDPAPHGQPGALESLLGGEGLKSQWQARWSPTATSLPQNLHATDIFDHALRGDPLAASLLDQAARMLASTIYNTSLLLNTPLFILGGTIGLHPALLDATRTRLTAWGPRITPRLLPSPLGPDAQLHGAITLASEVAKIDSRIAFRPRV